MPLSETRLTPQQSQDLWKRGIPLGEAFHRFGPKEQAARYVELEQSLKPVGLPEFIAKLNDAAIEHNGDIAATFQAAGPVITPAQREAEKLADRLKAICLRRLLRGELLGFGFGVPRAADATPVPVPADCWGGFVNWQDHRVCSGSLRMEAVRIVPAHWIEEAALADRIKPDETGTEMNDRQKVPEPVRPGRKTRKAEILAAYAHLTETGTLRPGTPNKTLGHLIREQIFQNTKAGQPNDEGLSDETIRRILHAHTQNTN